MKKKSKKKKVSRKKTSTAPWWWKFIRSRARQVMKWSPEKKRVIAEAKGFCPGCKKLKLNLEADHIEPVVPVDQPFIGDWNTYFDRMFNGKLQALCDECHEAKCFDENKLRKHHRDIKKANDAKVTSEDLDEFAKRFVGVKNFPSKKDCSSQEK